MGPHKELEYLRIGEHNVPVKIRVNKQAKRIILKVDGLKNIIQITCPREHIKAEALAFAYEKRHWIEAQLDNAPACLPFAADMRIPFEGEMVEIKYLANSTRAVKFDAQTREISVGGQPEFVNGRVTRWLRARAKEKLTGEVEQFCHELGVSQSKVTVRDTKSRWGSCSSQGALSFSWRLILAPPHVLTYVAAHEVAHLKHLDHSPAFWRVVDGLVDHRRQSENWLKKNGQSLYAFGIEETRAA